MSVQSIMERWFDRTACRRAAETRALLCWLAMCEQEQLQPDKAVYMNLSSTAWRFRSLFGMPMSSYLFFPLCTLLAYSSSVYLDWGLDPFCKKRKTELWTDQLPLFIQSWPAGVSSFPSICIGTKSCQLGRGFFSLPLTLSGSPSQRELLLNI